MCRNSKPRMDIRLYVDRLVEKTCVRVVEILEPTPVVILYRPVRFERSSQSRYLH